MTVAAIRKRLVDYLQIADDKKIKAIFTMVEDDINIHANSIDDEFMAELESRSRSFADGSAKTYSWEETKLAAVTRVKALRK